MQNPKSRRKIVIGSIVVMALILFISSCAKQSTQHSSAPTFPTATSTDNANGSTTGYQPPEPTPTGGTSSTNGNGSTGSTSNSTQTTSTQRFACSSGTYTRYELPWNPQGFKIVTDYGDTVFIENEYGPTDTVNWQFDNNSWMKLSAVGTTRDNIHLGKGSKQVMKLDGATGNFNPDTEFYNYVNVCSAWSVTTVNFN